MEMPHLGKHCSESTCKQLDFLPVKCDACSKIFCMQHMKYTAHSCEASYKKNFQVPVCPLCDQPVPINRGELPDIKMGEHIDRDCQSDPAKANRKVYSNKCRSKGCKQKELVKVTCNKCHQNYCIKHRHPEDHNCEGASPNKKPVSKAGNAAITRQQLSTTRSSHQNIPSSTSNSMKQINEDEALARALQDSFRTMDYKTQERPQALNLEDEDAMLAQAIALSEQEAMERLQQQPRHEQKNAKCSIS